MTRVQALELQIAQLKDALNLQCKYNQELREKIHTLDADERRLTMVSAEQQLLINGLRHHRDTLLNALADAQVRVEILRRKTRPCGCGSAIQEFSEGEDD